MAAFAVNGTGINPFNSYSSVTNVTATSTTEFTLSWSGIPTSGDSSQTMLSLELRAADGTSTATFYCSSMTNSPNTIAYMSWVGTFPIGMYINGLASSGSLTFSYPSGLVGCRLSVDWSYNGSDSSIQSGGTYVNFISPTPGTCVAPSNVAVSASESTGGNVSLTFTEGAGNTLNTFQDYLVQYSDDSGSTWADLTTGTSSPISAAVPSTVGVSRTYRIRTRGSAGSSYYSSWAYSSNSVLRTFALSQPIASLVSSSGSHCELYIGLTSTITGGSGTITYEFYRSGDSTPLLSTTDSTMHYTVAESSLSTTNSFYIRATCTVNSITKTSSSDPVVFTYDPTFTDASGFGVTPQTGSSATLAWTPGSLSGGGTVSHQLSVSVDSGVTYTVLSSAAATPYAISQADLVALGATDGMEIRFTLVASGNGNTGVTQLVTFTYSESAAASIYVSYYDGSSFVDCYADRWDGTQWVRQEIEMLEQGE